MPYGPFHGMFIFKTEFSLNGETDSVATGYTVLNINMKRSIGYITGRS